MYLLTFRDGCQYAGQTRGTLRKRLQGHYYANDRGSPVHQRLRAGQVACVEVLAEGLETQTLADSFENNVIAGIPVGRRLNRPTVRKRQKSPEPPVDGCYLCTWCKQWRAVKKMSVDRRRSRGRGSKCRDCYATYGRVQEFLRRAAHLGFSVDAYSVSYHVARTWQELGGPVLNSARMWQWTPHAWRTLAEGNPAEFDRTVEFLARLPPPPPLTWAEVGRMGCCGAPVEAPWEPTSKFAVRHANDSRGAGLETCFPARECQRWYDHHRRGKTSLPPRKYRPNLWPWDGPERMPCCGAPLAGDEVTAIYCWRHAKELRGAPRRACTAARRCRSLANRRRYSQKKTEAGDAYVVRPRSAEVR